MDGQWRVQFYKENTPIPDLFVLILYTQTLVSMRISVGWRAMAGGIQIGLT